MKKNLKLNEEQSVQKFTLLSSTIIIFIVATVMGLILIQTEFGNFKTHINNFEKALIEQAKFNVKTSVENLKNDIIFDELSILNNKKLRIKSQSIIAYNLASSLYSQTMHLGKEKQIEIIKFAINDISEKQNDIHYFILDTNGVLLLNSENHNDENENFIDFKDINGKSFITQMIMANDQTQNYLEYFWYKPQSSITAKKVTYTRHLKELGLIIGSGSFMEERSSALKNRILQKITNQKYTDDEYVFIYKINSLNNITKQSELFIEKHIKSNESELKAVDQLLKDTNYKGNEFIHYENDIKLVYATYISHLRYFIAVGTDLTNIHKLVANEKDTSLNNLYKNIFNLVVIITVMTLIFFIFSLLFTKKIAAIFKKYKQNVIQNEEKYHLLFNHSNDAFIISQLDEKNKAKIINWNKTAMTVSFYFNNELLDKDIFEMFIDLKLEEILNDDSFFKTVKMKTKLGEIKTIELNAITYENENQRLLFTSLRDITERTLLKEDKIKQEKILIQKSKMAAMGEMIGNIAHQWRQPLSQISGLFFDIENAYNYKELNKTYLKDRVNEANDLVEYMSKTIDDFRNFFNPNAKLELFLIQDAVDNAVKIVGSTLSFHNMDIEILIDEDVKINGYKNEYSQAVLNIISNAKDILLEREIKTPQIKIYLDKNQKNKLYIEDNAGGIPEDIIDKIFDPYFTTKFEYGTGIGLYMTKLIIENKMNGTINVTNSSKGAVFTIEI
ncbi:histidine kinase [Arcobacter sp. 31_11_sub10_T18]|nr:histidine kinase [Arcobacter sp. 31_11_sub10_T18]